MTTWTPDTSVVVAGLSSWHPDHDVARPRLAERPVLVAHVLAEAYAVLTRLPRPRRLDPAIVMGALRSAFAPGVVTLDGAASRPLLERLAVSGVVGGGTFDAVVAATAQQHQLTLVTLDKRARTTYDAIGVDVEFLG